MSVQSGGARPEHNIALLGPPSSGKTTFLAALSIALTRRDDSWNVVGADDASAKKLIEFTNYLNRGHAFPEATVGIERYRWRLVGQVTRAVRRKWLGTVEREESVSIGLDLADASGELAGPDQVWMQDELIETLARSRGIVFIFDPIRESSEGDAFDHTFGVVAKLAQRMIDTPEFSGGRLPHYIAVCVSKFDEIKILSTAEKLGLVVSDDNDKYGFPRVDDSDAREFLVRLCDLVGYGNAELVPKTLEKNFRRERIRYFVTSAIGFHVDPATGVYDPDDFQNQLPDQNQPRKTRIRGAIYPINVVEPLLWLGRQLAGDAGEVTRP